MSSFSGFGNPMCGHPSQNPWLAQYLNYLIKSLIALLGCIWVSSSGFANEVGYTPQPGTIERKQLLRGLREVVEIELKKPVIFRIDTLRVSGGWAYIRGVPLKKSGKPMDYRDTPYQESIKAGVFDDWICALLQKQGKQWVVVAHAIGATDMPFINWAEHYRAPAEIFE